MEHLWSSLLLLLPFPGDRGFIGKVIMTCLCGLVLMKIKSKPISEHSYTTEPTTSLVSLASFESFPGLGGLLTSLMNKRAKREKSEKGLQEIIKSLSASKTLN